MKSATYKTIKASQCDGNSGRELTRWCVCGGAYLSRLLLVRAVVHLVDLLGEVGKVWDDEFSLKSICQQHDAVADTPAGRYTTGRAEELKS